jgi:hypothetical protein
MCPTSSQQVTAGTAQQFSGWQQMKKAFQQCFQPYDMQEEALKGLNRLVQLRSVAEYTSKFVEYMLQLPGMLDSAVVMNFLAKERPRSNELSGYRTSTST